MTTKSKPKAKKPAARPKNIRSAKAAGRWQWNPRVACRTLDGTAFILLNSRMLRLNEVGTFIWESFEHAATIPQVVAKIVREFDTTATRALADAQGFVGVLAKRDVLVPVRAKTGSGRSL
ncbi:MAG: PqqD family protein [Deltaproteobacteria bacterium]|nr:PqqD family protein [Deltaproteobacteria bacterium]